MENPAPPTAPAAETPVARLRASDAAVDRAYLSATGFTTPRGSTTIQLWVPTAPVAGMAEVSYAATDWLQLAAGGVGMVLDSEDSGGVGFAAVKVAVVRGARFGVAAEAQVMGAGDETQSMYTAAASQCLDAACHTVISGYLALVPMSVMQTDTTSGTALHVAGGGSLVTGGRFKLVVDSAIAEDNGSYAGVVYVGARAARGRWAVDAGLVGYGSPDGADVLPVPLAALAARF